MAEMTAEEADFRSSISFSIGVVDTLGKQNAEVLGDILVILKI
jgi:hypothetical protein